MHFKRSILFFLLVSAFSYQLHAGDQGSLQSRASRYFNVLKTGAKISAAVGAALLAHVITEYPIVVAHEYGHDMGGRLTGGTGGTIEIECNLAKSPLAVLMPFFGSCQFSGGNRLVRLASGPLAGIGANYAIMSLINSMMAFKNGASKREIAKAGLVAPLYAFKNVSDGIAQTIGNRAHHTFSFSEIFLVTFNALKASRMFGEFVYGLTPFSIRDGDGQRIWQELGLKKDYTVSAWTGLGIGTAPVLAAIAFGLAKGISLRCKKPTAVA